MKKIEIGHGSGGRLTRELIHEIFLKHLDSTELRELEDAASLNMHNQAIAFTTDTYVINPLFFPGGDIGKLSVCGTINDLIVSGAQPRFISAGFVIEEGFPIGDLETIVMSMARVAGETGIRIVTGDTKVVEKGNCDGVYINTSGIGEIRYRMSLKKISPGDLIIVTGTVGDHGISIALSRNEFQIETEIKSDCAPLNDLILPLFDIDGIKWMRDPTRGGVAGVLVEVCEVSGLGIEVEEEKIPVREDVRFVCEMLGYDPLYLANEGRAVIIASEGCADRIMNSLLSHPLGRESAIIGRVSDGFRGVRLRTSIGGERIIDLLDQEMLPRIC